MTPRQLLEQLGQPPAELLDAVAEFWPVDQVDNALAIAWLESHWSAFAEANTTAPDTPCGALLRNVTTAEGTQIAVTAERSIGWFQINACNLPADWNPAHLFNTRHNVGTAHKLFDDAGGSWRPWFFSAQSLGLI